MDSSTFNKLANNLIILNEYSKYLQKNYNYNLIISDNKIRINFLNDSTLELPLVIHNEIMNNNSSFFESNDVQDFILFSLEYMSNNQNNISYKQNLLSRTKIEESIWKKGVNSSVQVTKTIKNKNNKVKAVTGNGKNQQIDNFNNISYSDLQRTSFGKTIVIVNSSNPNDKEAAKLQQSAKMAEYEYNNKNKVNKNVLDLGTLVKLCSALHLERDTFEHISDFWLSLYNIMGNGNNQDKKYPLKKGKLKIICQMYIIKMVTKVSFSGAYELYGNLSRELNKQNDFIYNYEFYDPVRNIPILKLKNLFDDYFRTLQMHSEYDTSFLNYEDTHKNCCKVMIYPVSLLKALLKKIKDNVPQKTVFAVVKTFNTFFNSSLKEMEVYDSYNMNAIKINGKSYYFDYNYDGLFDYNSEKELSKVLNKDHKSSFKIGVNQGFIHTYIYMEYNNEE